MTPTQHIAQAIRRWRGMLWVCRQCAEGRR